MQLASVSKLLTRTGRTNAVTMTPGYATQGKRRRLCSDMSTSLSDGYRGTIGRTIRDGVFSLQKTFCAARIGAVSVAMLPPVFGLTSKRG